MRTSGIISRQRGEPSLRGGVSGGALISRWQNMIMARWRLLRLTLPYTYLDQSIIVSDCSGVHEKSFESVVSISHTYTWLCSTGRSNSIQNITDKKRDDRELGAGNSATLLTGGRRHYTPLHAQKKSTKINASVQSHLQCSLDVHFVRLVFMEQVGHSRRSPSRMSTLQILLHSLELDRKVVGQRANVISRHLEDARPGFLRRLEVRIGSL